MDTATMYKMNIDVYCLSTTTASTSGQITYAEPALRPITNAAITERIEKIRQQRNHQWNANTKSYRHQQQHSTSTDNHYDS